jgi:hypothetical protein
MATANDDYTVMPRVFHETSPPEGRAVYPRRWLLIKNCAVDRTNSLDSVSPEGGKRNLI